jgi:hypothetical protein
MTVKLVTKIDKMCLDTTGDEKRVGTRPSRSEWCCGQEEP